MAKKISSTYKVAKYLSAYGKGKICDMKRVCGANNVAERVRQLRETYKWTINNVDLGYVDGVRVCEYKLINQGEMPKKYR